MEICSGCNKPLKDLKWKKWGLNNICLPCYNKKIEVLWEILEIIILVTISIIIPIGIGIFI